MATTMTLSQVRDLVRQRADMVNSQFITDEEFNTYINQSYFELYDLLVQKYGDNYYVASAYQFTTDGTSYLYDLPDDFYKLLGVDLALTAAPNGWITIKPFNFSDRNRYSVPNFQSFYGLTNLRYRLNGNQIWLNPVPAAGQTVQLWYVPRLSTLVDDSDTVDGVSGWTEYIVVDCVIKALQKEESDTSVALIQKQAIIDRINAAAENRDAGSPKTVSDTSSSSDMGWGPGNGAPMGGGN